MKKNIFSTNVGMTFFVCIVFLQQMFVGLVHASCGALALGTDLRITGSTLLLGNLSMNQNKMTVDSLGNTVVGGTLGSTSDFSVNTNKFNVTAATGNSTVAGTLGVTGASTLTGNVSLGGVFDITGTFTSGGWHHIKGQKAINSIGTTATPVLTITFANLAGSSSPLFKGAFVRLYIMVAGSVTLIVTALDSINYYEGHLIVSPGATSGAACTLNSVSEVTSGVLGNLTTLTSSVSGTGLTATVKLTSSALSMTKQSVAIFYEVIGDNIASVS